MFGEDDFKPEKYLKNKYIPKERGDDLFPRGKKAVRSYMFEYSYTLDIRGINEEIVCHIDTNRALFNSFGVELCFKNQTLLSVRDNAVKDTYLFILKPEIKKQALKAVL